MNVRSASALAAAALLGGLAGCASSPDATACQSIREVGCDGGFIDDASGDWATSGWSGPLIPYPAYSTIRLCHGLGRTPQNVALFAAFAPGGSLAQQIGNVLTVLPSCDGTPGITDHSILLRNGGGTDFYARFVLTP